MTLTAPHERLAASEPALIRVLLADDSAAIRTLARYSLTAKRGFSLVAEASDGTEALTLFDMHQPDCVVLDIEMPGMGGFEALAELRRRRPTLPVVMLSGYSDEAVTRKAAARGAAAYVEKNDGLVALADTVRRVTDRKTSGPIEPAATVPASGLSRLEAKADAAASDMRRLEYVVSHDFAEPARVISGFATLLDSRYGEVLDESGRLFVQHLVSGAERLQAMVDDLLVFSRAGRATPDTETVDTTALVTRVASELTETAPAHSSDIQIGRLPAVQGDSEMIGLVFRQLLINAVTFTTCDSPRVTVDGHVVGEFTVLTVTDNGIGISAEHCAAVFELFRRLNTREEYPGTGTGLALCRRLVELQGGTIRLDSTTGSGTTVTVALPAPPAQPRENN